MKPKRKKSAVGDDPDFDRWFDAYDWTGQPGKARKVWKSAVTKSKARGGVEFLIACAELERKRWGEEPQKFRTHPHTWLRDGLFLDIADADLPETPEHRWENFYRHYLKTGHWRDDDNELDDMPVRLRERIDGEVERSSLEAAGQRALAL